MRTRAAIVCATALAILLPTAAAAATKRVAVPEIGSPTPVAVMTGHGKIPHRGKTARERRPARLRETALRQLEALLRAQPGQRRRAAPQARIPVQGSLRSAPQRSQQAAIRALLPKDQATAEGWEHQVASFSRSRDAESLWSIAEWFTGAGENHRCCGKRTVCEQRHPAGTGDPRPAPRPRRTLRRHVARGRAPDGGHPLQYRATPFVSYGSDGKGEYASYRLKAGEALYSSVVMAVHRPSARRGRERTGAGDQAAQRDRQCQGSAGRIRSRDPARPAFGALPAPGPSAPRGVGGAARRRRADRERGAGARPQRRDRGARRRPRRP